MALRGLSHPTTSRQGNQFGMAGMALAIVTTLLLASPSFGGLLMILAGLGIGGGAGAYIARRIPMTAMPQLVAAFHSLVGLAAVLVAAAALYAPSSFGIGDIGSIHGRALVEMAIGVAIGAVTFTGSIIAFLKLDGRMSGKPIMLPVRHQVNLLSRCRHCDYDHIAGDDREPFGLLADRSSVADFRRPHHHPDRRRGYAGRGFNAQFLFRLGGGGHRLHARQSGADHHRRLGRLVRRDPVLHYVQGHEPLVHLGHIRRLRRRSGCVD